VPVVAPAANVHGFPVKVPVPVCVKLTVPVGVVGVSPPPLTVSVTVATQDVVPALLTVDGLQDMLVEVVSCVVTLTLTVVVRS